MGGMIFVTDCIHSDGWSIRGMIDESRDISRRTFLQHVDRENLREVELRLGYSDHPSHGLTMAGDYHVSYSKSVYRGRPCVYFTWSAIEHIFC